MLVRRERTTQARRASEGSLAGASGLYVTILLAGAMAAAGGCGASGSAILPRQALAPGVQVTQADPLLDPAQVGGDAEQTRVARSQRPDADLPTPPGIPGSGTALPNPSMTGPPEGRKLTVRAWVNGKPIFDDEVMAAIGRHADQFQSTSPAEHPALLTRLFNEELNQIIERELVLQDAFRKLEKNAKYLDKLKQAAAKDFEKKLKLMARRLGKEKEGATSIEQVKFIMGRELVETMRRQEERNFIASEYVRSRIYPLMQRVNHEMIRDYYDQHRSEFRTIDKVKWQDVFVAVGPSHPTSADARRFAEGILARVQKGESFDNFLRQDEGDSWSYRKGEGNGQRRGEIKPVELEPHLFQMKDGQVGPVVELSTGVHIFRLLKRDYAGQMPFDDAVQTRVGNTLKGQIADREYKRIVKELKERAIVVIEKGKRPGQ